MVPARCAGAPRVCCNAIDWRGLIAFADGTFDCDRAGTCGLQVWTKRRCCVEMYGPSTGPGRPIRVFMQQRYLRIAAVVPLLWPVADAGHVPGIRQIGDAAYRFVAARRARRGRCTDDLCRHSPGPEPAGPHGARRLRVVAVGACSQRRDAGRIAGQRP